MSKSDNYLIESEGHNNTILIIVWKPFLIQLKKHFKNRINFFLVKIIARSFSATYHIIIINVISIRFDLEL